MAEKVKGSSQNRINLGEVLPLDTPLTIHIFPSYYCDFKCRYCIQSLDSKYLNELDLEIKMMDLDLFKKIIDQIKMFGKKLKVLNFAGHGEPLLNDNLPKMIAYAKKKDIANKIELVTNANSLTNEKSDALIEAGLDSLRISIQGMDREKYYEISKVDIDYEIFLNQIKYFYEKKRACNVYIKIIDVSLRDGEEAIFYKTFGSMCDRIAIEYMVPTARSVNYEKLNHNYYETQQGYDVKEVMSCPYPFYMMIIEPNGNIRTCCSTKFPILIGNIRENSLLEVWNGKRMMEFRKLHLNEGKKSHNVCNSCDLPMFGLQPGDNIDNYRLQILEKID